MNGGYRPGGGRPRKGAANAKDSAAIKKARKGDLTPLDYMLQVMNDPDADETRRDRMAQAAAPYVHAKPGETKPGKKEVALETAQVVGSSGRFAVPPPPKHVMN